MKRCSAAPLQAPLSAPGIGPAPAGVDVRRLPEGPFVLLDDARADGGACRLYGSPSELVVGNEAGDVESALRRVRSAVRAGAHAAGFIRYEAGGAFERRVLRPKAAKEGPVLWFGLFDRVELLGSREVEERLPEARGAWIGEPRARLDYAAYAAAFDRVAGYIEAGDIYQANLSYRADVPFAGHPLALYARLRGAAAGWGGVAFTGEEWVLSASPEMFFSLRSGRIEARPMKGTARRGVTASADAAAALRLAEDPKQRAENLMIVDLLRNDVSRVSVPGSVSVPALFTVETYPTLHTLTSTITATLRADADAIDVLQALFPCGSVTGAPKIRAQEIIAEVEHDSRGAYTGSLGYVAPDGEAAFNVLIRTLTLAEADGRIGQGHATVGLGGAVVSDSLPADEWDETIAKSAFVTQPAGGFELVETLRYDAASGMANVEWHLERMSASAASLGFPMPPDVLRRVERAVLGCAAPARIRLTLDRSGEVGIELGPMPPAVAEPVSLALAPLPVDALDFRLRHKTSERDFYDDARRVCGAFEVVFFDKHGYVTEGSFTNVFVERGGMLLTPGLGRGLLPGVLRRRLLDDGRAREADLRPSDLESGPLFVGNSLRGLIRARMKSS